MKENLSPVQGEIYKAIEQMKEKSTFTEFVLAKKIRENAKITGKKKAGIGLSDLQIVLESLSEEKIFYSIHINSVNEILLKKEDSFVELPAEQKHRRQASEKSMSIFTNSDVNAAGSGKNPGGKKQNGQKKRSERKSMNINDWENFDD